MTRLCQVISSVVEYYGRLEGTAFFHLENSLHGLSESGKVLEVLPAAHGSIHLHLLEHCRDARVRSSLESFIGEIEDANTTWAAINEATQDRGASLLEMADDKPLRSATKTLAELGFGHESLTEIGKALDGTRQAERELADSQRLFHEVAKTLGCECEYSANGLDLALETIQIIEGAPFEILHLRRAGFEADGAARIVRAASELAGSLLQEQVELEREVVVPLALAECHPEELTRHARIIEEARWWQKLFGTKYRKAKSVYQSLAANRGKRRSDQISKNLRRLAEHLERRRKFEGSAAYIGMLGEEFRGLTTRWPDIIVIAAWYDDVFVRLSDRHIEAERFRRVLFDSRLDRLKSLKVALGAMTSQRSSLMNARRTLSTTLSMLPQPIPPSAATTIKALVAHLGDFNETIASAIAVIEAAGVHPEVSPVDVDNCLVHIRDFRARQDSIQSQTDNHGFLGHSFAGLDTHVMPIRTTLQFAEAIDTSGLSEGTVECKRQTNPGCQRCTVAQRAGVRSAT